MKRSGHEESRDSDGKRVPGPTDAQLPSCESEPIHIPGAIQPHGAVIAALAPKFLITHASANLQLILGRPARALLGCPLEDAIGPAAFRVLVSRRLSFSDGLRSTRPIQKALFLPSPGDGTLYLHDFGSDEHLCLDIEPMHFESRNEMPVTRAQAVIDSFTAATNAMELCEIAVSGLKGLTGYDRVMAYRFAPDGHGEVIAEARAPGLPPYLGQHYPASDIPAQARRLYLRQRVGAVADAAYQPVPLLVGPAFDLGPPLDLTESALRSVSPLHREYMRNMGTAASLTIGIADGPELWGMLVCHHATPRIAGPELRAAAHMIGQVVSLLLRTLGEAQFLAQRLQRNATLGALVEKLAQDLPLSAALASAATELLDMVGATGLVIGMAGTAIGMHGKLPDRAAAERAFTLLGDAAQGRLLAIDDLGLRYPELQGCTSDGSGALFLPLASGTGDALLWFRPELSRVITWGGNPADHVTVDAHSGRISPRESFAAWKETVAGRAAAWTDVDQHLAGEVGSAVAAAVAQRTRRALEESEARAGLLAEHSSDVIILNNMDGIRRYVSPASLRVLGWRPEELVGRQTLDFVHPDDRQALIDARAKLLTSESGESTVMFRHRRSDDTWVWVDSRMRMLANVDGALPNDFVGVVRDATERKVADEKLAQAMQQAERLAATDGLTGLPNRRHFDAAAEREWRRCAREHEPLSVLLVDADRFKQYNDRYGHFKGDDCLCAVAQQIAAAGRRPADLAARYGGEEFVVLMPGTARAGAVEVAERARMLVQQMALPHEPNVPARVVTVSIGGAACLPGDSGSVYANVGALLQAADVALYQAKEQGRNTVVVAL